MQAGRQAGRQAGGQAGGQAGMQCIYVLCVDLRTNSDYFPTQH
jgi:hypothetical protein